jgi:hypothetical protein
MRNPGVPPVRIVVVVVFSAIEYRAFMSAT